MTKLVVCAVRDVKAECFAQPFVVPAVGQAVRGFTDQVNLAPEKGSRNDLFSYPADFSLYELAEYDDQTGRFECLAMPRLVVEAVSVKS